MRKSIKYIFAMFLLVFARGCDFYSTSLWIFEPGGLDNEVNPLTQLFGVGWNGLVLVNFVVCTFIAYCYYVYIYKYKLDLALNQVPTSAIEYASILYYKRKKQLWKILYKMPVDKKIASAHTGYVATWGAICASFLAAIHNLLIFYDNRYYSIYMEAVLYPMFVFYFSIITTLLYFTWRLWKMEFLEYQKMRTQRT